MPSDPQTTEITKIEPMPKGTLPMLLNSFSKIQRMVALANIDDRYQGDLKGGGRCVWSKEGHRVEITMGGGAFMASRSKEVDPQYPGSKP
jgi:hypothetical protein